jgi:hypothetical protein
LHASVLNEVLKALTTRRRRWSVTGYARHKAQAAARQRTMVEEAQNIAPLPAVADPARRAKAIADFQFFSETYFADIFYLPWSEDHLRAIGKIEQAVREGSLFAHAMPRASGKTMLAEVACLWAILGGYRPYVSLVAASAERAQELLGDIKTWLETNDLLCADWPEVCYPIRRLGRVVNRQTGQHIDGVPTRIEWKTDKVVLPTVLGKVTSGAVVTTSGLKASDIRGQHHALVDGRVLRPSLVLIDDPQTTESAWSVKQSERRERILAGDVLGMAGPDQKIAGIMCLTVIRPGDMADVILDRVKHPEWQGERTKMVYAFPKNEKLWDEYKKLREESLRLHGDIRLATEFYAARQAEMDDGAVVAWPARFYRDKGELSAVQHAMNLKCRDEAAFFAEYQNEPVVEDGDSEGLLTADQIAAKTNGLARLAVPVTCQRLTAFVDIQKALLFYSVCAWDDDFTGYVVDYGAFPDQQRAFFTLRDARVTLGRTFPKAGMEGAIRAGLDALVGRLMNHEWRRDDGAVLRIERLFIDANWGESTGLVYQFCRESPFGAAVMPSHGRGVSASQLPFSEYRRKAGDQVGHNWRVPGAKGRNVPRHVLFDTNYWKSFLHARLAVPHGDRGDLSLWGRQSEAHRLIAEHLTAEVPVKTQGRNRTLHEWKPRANAFDNHWFDCLVGCVVGAAMCGVTLPGVDVGLVRRHPRGRVRLSTLVGR